jgi:hypothetical protein
MTTAEQIQARLVEFHVVYQDIHVCLEERAKLQPAEQAQAEYKRETSRFEPELAELSRQKDDLGIKKRKLEVIAEKGAVSFRPPPVPAQATPGHFTCSCGDRQATAARRQSSGSKRSTSRVAKADREIWQAVAVER